MKNTRRLRPLSGNELTALWNEAKKAFKLELSGTQHGPGHWEQVEKNVINLAKNTPGCDVDVARLFAVLHDCQRQNEGKDQEHGARAAEFAQKLFERGMLHLDPSQFAALKFAIKYHNDGQVSNDPTIGACWDADRLDLPRVGTTPSIDLLSTRYAKELLRL